MLREIPRPHDESGAGTTRRWFSDSNMDLCVWSADDGTVTGFQLAYDKHKGERALTWQRDGGFRHSVVDDGELSGGHKGSPLLSPGTAVDASRLRREFQSAGTQLDRDLFHLILNRLSELVWGG